MKHVTKMKHTGFELGIHSHKLKTIRHDWESFHKQPLHLDEPQKKKKKRYSQYFDNSAFNSRQITQRRGGLSLLLLKESAGKVGRR